MTNALRKLEDEFKHLKVETNLNNIDIEEDKSPLVNHLIKDFKKLPKSYKSLIKKIDNEMEHKEGCRTEEMMEIMKTAKIPKRDIMKFGLIMENSQYTRNLIWETKHYALILLTWNPGKIGENNKIIPNQSVIHTHGGSKCWARVLANKMNEKKYDMIPFGADEDTEETIDVNELYNKKNKKPGKLRKYSDQTASEGEVLYINDSIGMHSLGNPTERYSYTLHCYAPGIKTCKYFTKDDKNLRTATMEYHGERKQVNHLKQ